MNTSDRGGGAEGSAWNLFKACQARGHAAWLAVGCKRSTDPDVLEIPRSSQHLLSPQFWKLLVKIVSPWEKWLPGVWRIRHWSNILVGGRLALENELGLEHFNYPGTCLLPKLPPERPDIIHLHNLHGDYFDLRALPRLSRRFPVILNLRDAWLLGGHCAHPLDCERWRTGCGDCRHLDTYPGLRRDATAFNWRRKRRIYSRSRLYIATPSRWLMDRVKASMLTGVEYRVIPNGIDLGVFCPGDPVEARRRLGLPQRAGIVLLTAHNPFKDYSAMEAALARMTLPKDPPLIFVCLGRDLSDRIIGQGRMSYRPFVQDPQCLADYYRAADVFILASKDEVFGKTLAEAMACATPVVATAVGGIPEVVDSGVTGFLVPQGDVRAMSGAIERLLTRPDLRRRMGRAAAEHADRRFGLDRQVEAFLAWYDEILSQRTTSHKIRTPPPHDP